MVIEQGGVQFVLVITRFRVQFEIHLPEKVFERAASASGISLFEKLTSAN